MARAFCPRAGLIQRVFKQHRGIAVAGQPACDTAMRQQIRAPQRTDRANNLVAGGKSRRLVNGVHLVEIGVDDARNFGRPRAQCDFLLESRPAHERRLRSALERKLVAQVVCQLCQFIQFC